MPPIRVSLTCLECDYKTSRMFLKAMKMAQTHSDKSGHEVILHSKPGGILVRTYPRLLQEREPF